MPHHCEDDSDHGTSCRLAPECMIVVSPSPKALDTGDTYEFTFTKAGDFAYFCGLHSHMQGKITVAP